MGEPFVFACIISFPPELKGGDINLGAVLFYEVGANFLARGGFFVANLAPGAISFYQGGDICRGAKLFYDTGRPIRFRIVYSNRIGRIPRKP